MHNGLAPQGQKKATIAEILNGEPFLPPWLSEGAMHFIRWALTKEQGKRPSVQQLAEHPWIVSHMKPRPAAPGEGIRRAIGRTGGSCPRRSQPIASPLDHTVCLALPVAVRMASNAFENGASTTMHAWPLRGHVRLPGHAGAHVCTPPARCAGAAVTPHTRFRAFLTPCTVSSCLRVPHTRADSFVELRQLGFRGSNAPVGDTSPTGSKVPTVLSVMQGGRTLGHSNSMSAMDGMRFRDIKLDSVPGAMAAAAESALAAVKRVSDGDGTTGGRPSAAGGRVSRAGTARNSGTGGLSRMNSMNAINAAAVALAAAAAVGGTNETESPKAGGKGLMTREELLASLTAPFPSPRSGSGSPSLMRSFTAGHGRSSPMVQPTASQLGMRISGGGNVTSAGTSGSPALARGQSPGRSPLHRSAPFEPGTMNPAAGGGNGGSSSTSDALAHDLAHVRIGDSSAPHSPSRLGVSSSTTSGASCLRPQPPQMPSPSSRGLKNGSPLIPSRLSQSFTSPMSPLAGLGGSAGAAQTQPGVSPQPPATISRLGQSATTPSAATPAGSSRAGSVQTPLEVPPYGGFGGGMGDSSGAASPRVQQQAASPSAGPGAESGAGTPRSVQGQSSGHNSPRGAGVEQECDSGSDRDSVGNSHGKRKSPGASAKGLFGSIRKVFS